MPFFFSLIRNVFFAVIVFFLGFPVFSESTAVRLDLTMAGDTNWGAWPQSCQKRIATERDFLLSKKNWLETRIQQSAPVIHYIGKQLKKMSLPEWLVWLPLLESSYRSQSISSAGAAGVWQLMPDTALRFGLIISDSNDERLVLSRSTDAALHYLQWLKGYFSGNWSLVLAAYNAGEMRVRQAQMSVNQNDYCSLVLPAETQRYVPRLLALLDIIKNARRYQFDLSGKQNAAGVEMAIEGLNTKAIDPLIELKSGVADPWLIPKAVGIDMGRRDLLFMRQPVAVLLPHKE